MILLLLLALAARDEVTDLLARLRATTDVSQQYQIASQLSQAAKPAHVPLLQKECDAGPAPLRAHLIRAIARTGSKEAQAALRGLCLRNDLASRAEAASALAGDFEDDSGIKLLLTLLPKLDNDDDKHAILSSLWGFYAESPETVQALVKFLEKEKSEALRRQALSSLSSHKDPGVVPALRKIANDPKDPLRFEALAQLVRRGDEGALEEGLKGLEAGAVDSLGAFHLLNAIEAANKKSVLPRLREMAEKHPDRGVRIAVVRALATMKDDKSLPLLSKLSEDADPAVAKVALESVIRLAGRGQMELLKKTAEAGDPLKRLEAAEALLQLDLREGLEGVQATLADKTDAYRSRAILILASWRRREALDLLLPLLDDAQEYVRNSARNSIISTLSALYPYLRFDRQASPEKLKAWWAKHRGD